MLALRWHPDQNNHPNAREHFQEIREAYETLIDPKKRYTYNQIHGITPCDNRRKKRVFRKNSLDESYCQNVVQKVLYEYFGIYWGRPGLRQCRDLRYDFHFMPSQVTCPRDETISYIRWIYCSECVGKGLPFRSCVICRGRGFVEELMELTVNIPAGCRSGYQIRIQGGGDHTVPNIPAGDLIVYIHVVTPPNIDK